jgi:hypothetical protein
MAKSALRRGGDVFGVLIFYVFHSVDLDAARFIEI